MAVPPTDLVSFSPIVAQPRVQDPIWSLGPAPHGSWAGQPGLCVHSERARKLINQKQIFWFLN